MLIKHRTAININSDGEVGIKGSDDLSITLMSFLLSSGATIWVSKKNYDTHLATTIFNLNHFNNLIEHTNKVKRVKSSSKRLPMGWK